jgi:hypothetical protein
MHVHSTVRLGTCGNVNASNVAARGLQSSADVAKASIKYDESRTKALQYQGHAGTKMFVGQGGRSAGQGTS